MGPRRKVFDRDVCIEGIEGIVTRGRITVSRLSIAEIERKTERTGFMLCCPKSRISITLEFIVFKPS